MLRRKPRTAIAHYFQAIFTFHRRWFRMRLTGE
ncbi:TPA: electron transfer flavoprotein, partial [Escherichia coli]|nr:electron transfer flavoprotein [Escherichia coli]HAJ6766743.1 electron transfer flavoprotein [Escherichia coli]